MVCCWEQELLGYHLTIVQKINNMMVEIDNLTRRFGHFISHHISIAALLRSYEMTNHPCAYAATKLSELGNVKMIETDNPSRDHPHYSHPTSLTNFLKIEPLIQPHHLHYIPLNLPL